MLDAAPWWCHAAISNKVTAAPLVGRFVDKDKAVPGLGADQGQGWVRPLPETLHFLSVNHVRKRREVGMAWQLPQCAKQNRAERTDRRLNVAPILLEQDPLAAQTSQGTWQRLTFFSCSAVWPESGSTSLTLNGLPCYCLGSVYLPSKRISWGETGIGVVNNIVAGSVLVSHKYILPNFTTSLPTEVSFI